MELNLPTIKRLTVGMVVTRWREACVSMETLSPSNDIIAECNFTSELLHLVEQQISSGNWEGLIMLAINTLQRLSPHGRWLYRSAVLGVGIFLFSSSAPHASASTFERLATFCGKSRCASGDSPAWRLVRDTAGNLYGATAGDGRADGGTVFEISPTGEKRILHSFCNFGKCVARGPALPTSDLILDVNGNLYGTTWSGGVKQDGAVFELERQPQGWKLITLYTFCSQEDCVDGATPRAGLTYQGAQNQALYDGISPLYGTTSAGGPNDTGTVYSLTFMNGQSSPSEQVLYSFCRRSDCQDGKSPQTNLVMDSGGTIYGTTTAGGSANQGVAFALSSQSQETVLYSFCHRTGCEDGADPSALAQGPDGAFYGTTADGGHAQRGTVFKLWSDGAKWNEKVLHSFCADPDCADGSDPVWSGVTIDAQGILFGTTAGGGARDNGTIFKIQGTQEFVIYDFCSTRACPLGSGPFAGVVMDGMGNLYGTTVGGGRNQSGTVYEFTP